jgi:hypothetical protein
MGGVGGAQCSVLRVNESKKAGARSADKSHYFLMFSIGIVGMRYSIERSNTYFPFLQESVPSERLAEIRPRLLSEESGLVSIFKFFIFSMLERVSLD